MECRLSDRGFEQDIRQEIMKVLIINSWSNEGSTGKIAFGLFNYLNSK